VATQQRTEQPSHPQQVRPAGPLARHGARVARRARLMAVLAAVLTVAGYLVASLGVGGPSLFSRLELGLPVVQGEALDGLDLLAANDPAGSSLQALWDGVDPAAPAVQAELAAVTADLASVPGVLAVLGPAQLGPAAVATDGAAILLTVQFAAAAGQAQQESAAAASQERLAQLPAAVAGSTVELAGQQILIDTIQEQVEQDLRTGEAVALPVSLLVMVLIFGGFAAAGVPLAGAVASIAGGLAALLGFTYLVDLDITVVNVVTVLGLGLCIDYSLLMVSRYREQLHDALDLQVPGSWRQVPAEVRQQAMAVTMATAGRTVIFSGLTVAIAVVGLVFIDMTIIRSVGAGAVSVVAIAVLVATTFVPALLVLATRFVAGPGLLARVPGLARISRPPGDEGWFSAWARTVQRRPWPYFLGVAALLVALSVPAWRMQLTSSGVELLPPDNAQRQTYEQIVARFPAAAPPPITVLAGAGDAAGLQVLADQVGQLRGVRQVGELRTQGDVVSFPVLAAEADAAQVVRDIRQIRADQPQTWVTGPTAILVDFTDQLRQDVPLALAFIVGATLVLLFLLTGSVLVPVKALLMNLLSLGATFGILVLIFQDGRLEGMLGYASPGGIEATLPVIIFAFAFGLSMDYEVFLLSRIKEYRDLGHRNDEAVRLGLQRTGRIITSAALLIVIVFAGFILGDLLAVKQNGVALAVAVLLDATLVRIVLVPATMTLLGEWNWWAPAPLRRFHDRLGLRH
jgi:RND superfamily putative drug exporter